jgi:hypothetical protein
MNALMAVMAATGNLRTPLQSSLQFKGVRRRFAYQPATKSCFILMTMPIISTEIMHTSAENCIHGKMAANNFHLAEAHEKSIKDTDNFVT